MKSAHPLPGDRGNQKDTHLILETNRLLLRLQTADDVDFLTDLWSDPEATRHLGGPRDRERLRAIFQEAAANPAADRYDLWPVAEKSSGQLVGYCGLLEKEVDGRREIELNYVFTPSAWGKGYAAEMGRAIVRWAFDALALKRLIALIAPENTASEQVARKIGMHLEKETVRPGDARRKVYAIEAGDEPIG